MGNHADPRFTESDAELIKRKAKGLVGHYGYRDSDIEDIEQELAMHLFQYVHRYDPTRGPRKAFVVKVLKNKLLHLIEKRTAKKRDNRADVRTDDVGEAALRDCRTTPSHLDMGFDVRVALGTMPDDLQRIAVLLMNGHTEAEIVHMAGLTRQKVRGSKQRIEKYFKDLGLAPEI